MLFYQYLCQCQLSLCYLSKYSDIPFCSFSSSPFIVVPFWIVLLPNGSRLGFYPKPSFFILNPVFFQSDPKHQRRSVWSHNAEKTSQAETVVYILYIFCIYSVYTYHLVMIWVGPTRALSEPRIKALRLDFVCQGSQQVQCKRIVQVWTPLIKALRLDFVQPGCKNHGTCKYCNVYKKLW